MLAPSAPKASVVIFPCPYQCRQCSQQHLTFIRTSQPLYIRLQVTLMLLQYSLHEDWLKLLYGLIQFPVYFMFICCHSCLSTSAHKDIWSWHAMSEPSTITIQPSSASVTGLSHSPVGSAVRGEQAWNEFLQQLLMNTQQWTTAKLGGRHYTKKNTTRVEYILGSNDH
jgi:hypothetical protein